jgi:hypothetical protein
VNMETMPVQLNTFLKCTMQIFEIDLKIEIYILHFLSLT